MPRSPWSAVADALVTVVMLIGPALLASQLEWPLAEHTTWTWLWQYLRGGRVPGEAVTAVLIVILWTLWAAHLVIVILDVIALLRGLVPRVGLMRLVWVLAAGGATVTSTHTAAIAVQNTTVVEALPEPSPGEQGPDSFEEQPSGQADGLIDRIRHLSYFGFDSAALTPGMEQSLQPTIDLIDDFGLSGAPVVVTGHTDPVGVPAYNQDLSERRAQAVVDYLGQHLDEDVEFEVRGLGSRQAHPNPRASYGEHRRVEIAYTLQRPAEASEPAPSAQARTEETTSAAPEPENVQLDVTTASEQSPGPDLALVGAVAGTVGLGVGYAVGRRRTLNSGGQPRVFASEPKTEDDTPSRATSEEPLATADPLREDPAGLACGVVDQDGYVLVADTVRVDGRDGIAFAGTHAAGVLRAVMNDHIPGPVIATRAVLAAMGGPDTVPSGVYEAADLHSARIAVEAELLAIARRRVDEVEDAEGPQVVSWSLLVCEASDLDSEPDLTASETVVCVLGRTDHAEVVIHCDDPDRAYLSSSHGRTDLSAPLRQRIRTVESQHGPAPDQVPQEEAAVPKAVSSSAAEHEGGESADTATASRSRRIQVRLLAPEVVLTCDGQPVIGLRSVARTLLVFLALHPEGVDAEQLASVCFSGVDPAKAVAHRRNAIHSLRATIRSLLDIPGEQIVLNEQGLYRIDESIFDVDLWKFLRMTSVLHDEGREVPRSHLEEILVIHKDNLLCGRDDEWIAPIRSRCTKDIVSTCVRLSKLAHPGPEKAGYLETALSFDRYNEALYQHVMVAHIESGSPVDAHQSYRILKEQLERIGEKPSQESRRIIQI